MTCVAHRWLTGRPQEDSVAVIGLPHRRRSRPVPQVRESRVAANCFSGVGSTPKRIDHAVGQTSSSWRSTPARPCSRSTNSATSPYPPRAAAAIFQVVSQRYLKTSIILTSNRGVGAWGEILGDTTVAAAMLDRLLHRSVAYVLAGIAGLDATAYSVGYIATWTHGNTDLIRTTAGNVLAAVEQLAAAVTDNDNDVTDPPVG